MKTKKRTAFRFSNGLGTGIRKDETTTTNTTVTTVTFFATCFCPGSLK
ncbi:hypothetical protein MUY27_00160 [Mucilaginibacter sp. RS28]|uniref:Uncharacterized protein n=1 Tax=Mucilaginibacter straminoryzae TaxID=2932774 RepID=A0A9X2B9U5_9SPHI|nr:hypothetical protein [Mucilaginibacter straminoryzae]MCJ8208097.1 hypothetical protein [Mucilaginibacter straminoryzae]